MSHKICLIKFILLLNGIQEFYSPILGPAARAYKDDAHEKREIQTKEWKRELAITLFDLFCTRNMNTKMSIFLLQMFMQIQSHYMKYIRIFVC